MDGERYTTLFAHSSYLYRALAQLPVLPKQSCFEFRAYDVALPKTVEGEERYLWECTEKQVLPYTVLAVEYDAKQKRSRHWIEQVRPDTHRESVGEREVGQGMLAGGKIHLLKLEIGEIKDEETLQHVAEQLLPDFAAQRYVLHHGDLWLTRYRMCPDVYGRGTSVLLQSPTPLELRLELASPISGQEKERLEEWFERVKLGK